MSLEDFFPVTEISDPDLANLFDRNEIPQAVLWGVRGAILCGADDVRTFLEGLARCPSIDDTRALVAAVLGQGENGPKNWPPNPAP